MVLLSSSATVLFGGVAAFADNAAYSFSGSVDALQQSRYLNSGNRTSSTTASQIKFAKIGNSQLMNVKAQNLQNNQEYTEVKGIGVGASYVNIPNSTPAGKQSRLVVTNHDWNFTVPQIAGTYIIH